MENTPSQPEFQELLQKYAALVEQNNLILEQNQSIIEENTRLRTDLAEFRFKQAAAEQGRSNSESEMEVPPPDSSDDSQGEFFTQKRRRRTRKRPQDLDNPSDTHKNVKENANSDEAASAQIANKPPPANATF